jgi:hypothetical protein
MWSTVDLMRTSWSCKSMAWRDLLVEILDAVSDRETFR